MIEVRALRYDYPGRRALDEVTFALPERSITALVGPNGAGKTTLLRCIAALDEPYSGNITVGGIDTQRSPRSVHRLTGFLPDHFGLYGELTARQCLVFAARAHRVRAAEVDARIEEIAAAFGIESWLGRPAGSLSRGQRQRLAMAQAIVHRPRVLLLDEPASGLDPEARHTAAALIRQLGAEGMTVLVSSHILAELETYCSAMLVLSEGRVIEHRALDAPSSKLRRIVVSLLVAAPETDARLPVSEALSWRRLDERRYEASLEGDEQAQAQLLQQLIAAGFPVDEFRVVRDSLEAAYIDAVRKRPMQGAAEAAP
jgi:ABC-2 type transport system ATP-binding protein